MLTLTIPVMEAAKPRKLAITTHEDNKQLNGAVTSAAVWRLSLPGWPGGRGLRRSSGRRPGVAGPAGRGTEAPGTRFTRAKPLGRGRAEEAGPEAMRV